MIPCELQALVRLGRNACARPPVGSFPRLAPTSSKKSGLRLVASARCITPATPMYCSTVGV